MELSDEQLLEVIRSMADLDGRIKLTYESGPYEITKPTFVARKFATAILRIADSVAKEATPT